MTMITHFVKARVKAQPAWCLRAERTPRAMASATAASPRPAKVVTSFMVEALLPHRLLIRLGGVTPMRQVRAMLELRAPYLAVVSADAAAEARRNPSPLT
jgi:hypothetical protein